MDYQKTLNLPQTDFPMKAGLVQKEPQILAVWDKMGLYDCIRKKMSGRPVFVLHDGPPYANGNIHIGHALNKILKDIIVRYKTMQGFDSRYIPGWDCHGLPIEHALLKELRSRKSDIDCLDLRRKAHDYAMKHVGIQREQFRRLGVMGEWDVPYLTLSPWYESWILKSLAELTRKGYIYRSRKPVNWCCECETALAEAEVEYENHTSLAVFVKFPVINAQTLGLPGVQKVSLLIWTTTPWTLPANVAVAVNGKFDYILVSFNGDVLLLEKNLSGNVFGKISQNQLSASVEILGEFKGDLLTQLLYERPFAGGEKGKVVTADYVTREDGTGLVHIAPGHGMDDYQTGLRHNLDIIMPVDDRGVFTAQGVSFAGKHVFKVNPEIAADLESRGWLFYSENIRHSYPHCWRCKKPVISRATFQWFLKVDHQGLREKISKTVREDVKWFPPSGEERISAMMATRPDWCLSRQRHWGVPVPAVRLKGSEEQYLFPELVENVARLTRESGSNVWFEKELVDLWPKDFISLLGGVESFEKTYDILDVWFDSGVSHRAVFHEMLKLPLPADLYLEGSDQHRGWFQSSIIPSVALDGKPPYRQVLTHGFVVDGEGRKMSKSLGNVIAPADIIANNGVDILRFWVASSNYSDDIRLSKEITDRLVDAYRKIRNTVRYLLANLDGFDLLAEQVAVADLLSVDHFVLSRYAGLIARVTAAYDRYDFSTAVREIYTFCNEDLSGFYLDILKDRLYTSGAQSSKRRSARTVLYHIVSGLVRMIAPVLVFTAEEMYGFLPGFVNGSSVHCEGWPQIHVDWINQVLEQRYVRLMLFRPYVLKALEDRRAKGLIGASLEARLVIRTMSQKDSEYFRSLIDDLPAFFIVSQVEVLDVENITGSLGDIFPETEIEIIRADGNKCPRCWNYRNDLDSRADYPGICKRCAAAIDSGSLLGKSVTL